MHFILATWENSWTQIENTRLLQNIQSILKIEWWADMEAFLFEMEYMIRRSGAV